MRVSTVLACVFLAATGTSVEVPAEIDWREKGLVTKVKDQLSCDGSFYFAAVRMAGVSFEALIYKLSFLACSFGEPLLSENWRTAGLERAIRSGLFPRLQRRMLWRRGFEHHRFHQTKGHCRRRRLSLHGHCRRLQNGLHTRSLENYRIRNGA